MTFLISQGKVATVFRWGGCSGEVGVQAVDVKFSQDLTRKQSLKSVNFWQSHLKNKKVTFFWDTMYIQSHNAVVTREIKLFQPLSTYVWNNYISARMEACLELFQNYFIGLLQLTNIFQRVQCRWNNFEIILELFQRQKQFYLVR